MMLYTLSVKKHLARFQGQKDTQAGRQAYGRKEEGTLESRALRASGCQTWHQKVAKVEGSWIQPWYALVVCLEGPCDSTRVMRGDDIS